MRMIFDISLKESLNPKDKSNEFVSYLSTYINLDKIYQLNYYRPQDEKSLVKFDEQNDIIIKGLDYEVLHPFFIKKCMVYPNINISQLESGHDYGLYSAHIMEINDTDQP